ncbi:hypothetical protein TNCV_4132131 [Trichonephila clavipes]|nr:hypothetical protein TNCV_4132131 [Trichonephila clavipes]
MIQNIKHFVPNTNRVWKAQCHLRCLPRPLTIVKVRGSLLITLEILRIVMLTLSLRSNFIKTMTLWLSKWKIKEIESLKNELELCDKKAPGHHDWDTDQLITLWPSVFEEGFHQPIKKTVSFLET